MADARSLFDDPLAGADLDDVVHRSALGADEADEAMAGLLAELDWQQHEIVMFGRRSAVPRMEAWHGDAGTAYTYSGITQQPRPWTPRLTALRRCAEHLAGAAFNSVLVNRYRDGRDGVAWHADDEPELGTDPIIGSVSLGATRRFQLRRRDDPAERREIELHHGDELRCGKSLFAIDLSDTAAQEAADDRRRTSDAGIALEHDDADASEGNRPPGRRVSASRTSQPT